MNHRSWLRKARASKTFVLFVVCLAIFTDMVVYGVVLPILPKLLQRIGYDYPEEGLQNNTVRLTYDTFYGEEAGGVWSIELLSGILFAAFGVGTLIATPFLGILSDRYRNRKVPMLVGLVGLAISTCLFSFSRDLAGLVVARFFQGVSGAATWVIGFAMLADTYAIKELGTVAGIALGFNTIGYLTGPTLGGVLAKYVSLDFPLYMCLVLIAIDFVARLLILGPEDVGDQAANDRIDHVTSDEEVAPLLPNDEVENQTAGVTPLEPSIDSETSPVPVKSLGIFQMMLIPEVILVCGMCVLGAASISCLEALLPTYLWDRYRSDEAMTAYLMLAFIFPNILTDALAGYLSGRYQWFKVDVSTST